METTQDAPPNEINLDSFANPFIDGEGDPGVDDSLAAESLLGGAPPDQGDAIPSIDEPVQEESANEEQPTAETDEKLEGSLEALQAALGGDKAARKKQNKGLREQLKDRNTLVDDLQNRLEAKEKELEDLRLQREEAEKQRQEVEHSLATRYEVGEYSPNNDPEVVEILGGVEKRLREAKLSLGPQMGEKLYANWETLVKGYNDALNGTNTEQFQNILEEHFQDKAYDVQRELRDLNSLFSKRDEVVRNNQAKHYQTVIGSHEARRKEAETLVSSVGAMEEAAQKEDPLNLNSIITFAVNGDAEYREEVNKVKASCIALAAGVRPFDIRDEKWKAHLDPMDPTKLTPKGEELRKAEIMNFERARQGLPVTLAQNWAAALLVPRLVQKVSELSARLGDEQGGEIEPRLETGGVPDPVGVEGGGGITEEMLDDPDKLTNPFLQGVV